jgi:4'-phosphopantetheinyl transferase
MARGARRRAMKLSDHEVHVWHWALDAAAGYARMARGARRRAMKLSDHEVHVWHWALELPPERLAVLERWLSPDERERAARFLFDRHRTAFIAARGTLRELLGKYLGCGPGEVVFSYSSYGKPSLASPASTLHFNLSHSGGVAAAAFTTACELGVDVERVDRKVDLAVADSYFSPYEIERLQALPAGERPDAFFRIWTRKEAFVKAQGQGLSLPLHGFDVTVDAGDPPAILRCEWDDSVPGRWTLWDVTREIGCPAAVALAGCGFSLQVFSQ